MHRKNELYCVIIRYYIHSHFSISGSIRGTSGVLVPGSSSQALSLALHRIDVVACSLYLLGCYMKALVAGIMLA
jgi:hypothetical protein